MEQNRDKTEDQAMPLEKLTEIVRLLHEHEWKLRVAWMQWFLLVQSILFATFGGMVEKQRVVAIAVCVLGFLISVSFKVAFLYNKEGTRQLKAYWDRTVERHGVTAADVPPVLGFRHETSGRFTDFIHHLLPWYLLPLAFLVAWIVMLVVAISRSL